MNNRVIYAYKAKSEWNKEMYTLPFEFINERFPNNALVLSLSTNKFVQESNEWVGFVQTIKIFIKISL